MPVVKQADLPWSEIARELVGRDHGGIDLCVIFVDARQIDIHASPHFEMTWLED